MKLAVILKLIWAIIPKEYLAEVVLQLLRKAATHTKTKWDDERVDEIIQIYYTLKASNKKLK